MSPQPTLPVHRLTDQFAGVYVAPLTAPKTASPPYEATAPHRHDFYYCVLLDQGTLELEVDVQAVPLTSPSLFLSYPGQVHQVVAAHPEKGWFLAFAPAVLDATLHAVLEQCLSEIILLPLTATQAADFAALARQAHAAAEELAHPLRQPVVQALVRAFVYQLVAAYLPRERLALGTHSARSLELTKAFRQLLRQPGERRRPAEYAAQLHVTASHLNDTVRAVTGFSVTYYIQQELMREAQRLLAYSALSVQEVAYALGYEDAHYFSRLFSKVVKRSPGAFRKQRIMS